MGEVYNVNVMRPAFIRMRDKNNRGVITEKFCEELNIGKSYYNMYVANVEKLFNATCNYCRVKNSPFATGEMRAEAKQPIYDCWKELLSSAEKEQFASDLRVCEDDVSNLVGFCQRFVNDANDQSRGKDDSFISHKVWAIETIRDFQKKVETDIGIRIAQVEVLSDEERDTLRAERKILSGWKKAEASIEEAGKQRANLIAIKAGCKGDEAKEIMDKQIEAIDERIKVLTEKCKKFEQKLYELHNGKPIETEAGKTKHESTEAEITAPAPKTRKSRSKKSAGESAK